jgi:hypothetical protein
MRSALHASFDTHRLSPAGRVWPSLVAVAALILIHAFTYIMSMVLTGAWTQGQAGIKETAYGQPLFVWGSLVAAALLVGLVIFDVRRHHQPFWRGSRYAIGDMLLAVLGTLIVAVLL